MPTVKYEINVAYKGVHDFTVTVDRNGPDNTNRQTAKMVLRTLRTELGPDYSLSLREITTTTHTTMI